jgi:hypothetical protein
MPITRNPYERRKTPEELQCEKIKAQNMILKTQAENLEAINKAKAEQKKYKEDIERLLKASDSDN